MATGGGSDDKKDKSWLPWSKKEGQRTPPQKRRGRRVPDSPFTIYDLTDEGPKEVTPTPSRRSFSDVVKTPEKQSLEEKLRKMKLKSGQQTVSMGSRPPSPRARSPQAPDPVPQTLPSAYGTPQPSSQHLRPVVFASPRRENESEAEYIDRVIDYQEREGLPAHGPQVPMPQLGSVPRDLPSFAPMSASPARPSRLRAASLPTRVQMKAEPLHPDTEHSDDDHLVRNLPNDWTRRYRYRIGYEEEFIRERKHYVYSAFIGAGGFGTVHLYVGADGIPYAIKYSDLLSKTRKAIDAIKDTNLPQEALDNWLHVGSAEAVDGKHEALVLEEVRGHDHFVQMKEHFIVNGLLYFVLEYCEEGCLGTFVKNLGTPVPGQHLPAREICKDWFKQICEGVAYLHVMDISHRDIKMDNILIQKRGEGYKMKLTDFGMSRFGVNCSDRIQKLGIGTPFISSFGGTLRYMAPEILRCHWQVKKRFPNPDDRNYDPKAADMWAMGVLFFFLMYRHFIFLHPNGKKRIDLAYDEQMSYNFSNRHVLDYIIPEDWKFLGRMIDLSPVTRMTAAGALTHPWFNPTPRKTPKSTPKPKTPSPPPSPDPSEHQPTGSHHSEHKPRKDQSYLDPNAPIPRHLMDQLFGTGAGGGGGGAPQLKKKSYADATRSGQSLDPAGGAIRKKPSKPKK